MKALNKYELNINESKGHKWAKNDIYRQLLARKLKGFFDYDYSKMVSLKGNVFKKEYPFLENETTKRPCFTCTKEVCSNCWYIPDTKIICIPDIVIMDHNGKVKQVIEIETKKELSPKKRGFYQKERIEVIIIDSEKLSKMVNEYEILKVKEVILNE